MANKNKSLLFVSDSSPNNRVASSVTFYRHLCRLEAEGWQINLLLHEGDAKNYEGHPAWRVKFLPGRRWWYPPYRPYSVLQTIRYTIFGLASAAFIAETKPKVVIGYLRGTYFSGLAASLASKFKLPLGYLYHDATEQFPDMYRNPVARKHFAKFKERIVGEATIVWAVSDRMVADENTAGNMKLLHSMTENVRMSVTPAWRQDLQTNPVLVHAGTVYNEIVQPLIEIGKALALLNGRLVFYTPSIANAKLVAAACPGNVEIRPPLPNVADTCNEIVGKVSALLVAYPRSAEDMPWVKSCFPSKFVQFTCTGLPCFLFTPQDSALYHWVNLRGYPSLLEGDSVAALKINLERLLSQESWEKCAERCQQLWAGEFNPDGIHRQLTDDLERLVGA